MEGLTAFLQVVQEQGVFVALFVVLLFYVLKQNAKREDKLTSCLERLGDAFSDIARDVGEIDRKVDILLHKRTEG